MSQFFNSLKGAKLRSNSGDSMKSNVSETSFSENFNYFLWNYGKEEEMKLEHNCCLFPSYAIRVGQGTGSHWKLKVRGRAFNRPKSSRGDKMVLALARKLAGINKGDSEYKSLKQRFGFFLDVNSINLKMNLDIVGLTNEDTMDINTEPIFEEPEEMDLIQFGDKEINNNKSSVNSNRQKTMSYSIEIKDGHFNEDIIVSDKTVQEWKHNNLKGNSNILLLQAQHTKQHIGVTGHVQLIEEEGISIISDIDDTIKDSGVYLGKKVVFNNTFLYESKEVTGMADVYKYWWLHGACFHYVSNSPWQLLPLLQEFFKKHSFPAGSAHLKLFDLKSTKSYFYEPQGAKRASILQLFSDFPKRKFILIGDSGEMDLELYTTLAREYPDKIIKIFIRDVTTPTFKKPSNSNLYKGSFSSSLSKGSTSSLKELSKSSKSSIKDISSMFSSWISKPNTFTNSPSSSHSNLNELYKKTSDNNATKAIPIPNSNLRQDSYNSNSSVDSKNSEDSTNSNLKLYTKFQNRINNATKGLSQDLVTIFQSPTQLLECNVVKLAFNHYVNN